MSHKEELQSQNEYQLALEGVKKELGEDFPSRSEFLSFEPADGLFQYGKDGYHGKNHAGRALLLGLLLSKILQKKNPTAQINQPVIGFCLALHDTHRKEVSDDPDHGIRAADWYESSDGIIPEEIKPHVLTIMRIHDVPTSDLLPEQQTLELQVVKDADKLERVRLNGNTVSQHERLDPNRLFFQTLSPNMIPIAKELFQKTQSKEEAFASIADAAITLGILKNE